MRSRREPCWLADLAGSRRWPTGKMLAARDPSLLSEWQVYRMVDVNPGAWSAFQFLVRERLREEGVTVGADGSVEAPG